MNYQEICKKAVKSALKLGATDAVCSLSVSAVESLSVYKGASEGLEMGDSTDLSIQVYDGQKLGSYSVNNFETETLQTAIENAYLFAKISPENPFAGLADKRQLGQFTSEDQKRLDLVDNTRLSKQKMEELALEIETAAYADKRVFATRGCSVSQSRSHVYTLCSNGFEHHSESTSFGASVSAVARKGDEKVTDHGYDSKRHFEDLSDMKSIGTEAMNNTVGKLNEVKLPKKGKMPVVLSPQMSASLLLRNLASCLSGNAIYQRASFINKDMLGQKLFGDNIQLLDNRVMPRGISSTVVSGSGIVGPESVNFVKDGAVENFTIGLETSRKLNMSPMLGRPTMYNGHFANGDISVEDLISHIDLGLYMTDVMGHGFNAVTGNMAFTVGGYVIRNGIVTDEYVLEATLSGNLKDILNETTFANDLTFKYNTPTALIQGVTIA